DVLVGETGAGVAGGEAVAGHPVVRKSDRVGRCAVINLVDACGRDGQGAGGDVGRGAGRGIGRVVGGIGAADRDAADRDPLGRADVLAGEAGAGVAGREAVASKAIIRESDGGGSGAVIDFVAPGGRDVQGASGDIGRGGGGVVKGVIGRVSPAH